MKNKLKFWLENETGKSSSNSNSNLLFAKKKKVKTQKQDRRAVRARGKNWLKVCACAVHRITDKNTNYSTRFLLFYVVGIICYFCLSSFFRTHPRLCDYRQ